MAIESNQWANDQRRQTHMSASFIGSLLCTGVFLCSGIRATEPQEGHNAGGNKSLFPKVAVGVVLDVQEKPVTDAFVAVETGEPWNRQLVTTQTDDYGRFKLAYDEGVTSPVQTLWIFGKQHSLVAVRVGERRHHRIVLPAADPCTYQVQIPAGYSLKEARLRPYAIQMNDGGPAATVPADLRTKLEVSAEDNQLFVLESVLRSNLKFVSVQYGDAGEQVFQADYDKLQLLPPGTVEVRLANGADRNATTTRVTLVSTRPEQPFTDHIPPKQCVATLRPTGPGVYEGGIAVGRVVARVLVPNEELEQPIVSVANDRLEAGEKLTMQVDYQSTVELNGFAVGVDGVALSDVIIKVASQPNLIVRTDDDGRFRCRVAAGAIIIETVQLPQRLLNRYMMPQLVLGDVGRMDGKREIRVEFPLQQLIAGKLIDSAGKPAGKHLRIAGYLESDFSRKLIDGVADETGQFNALIMVDGAKQALDRCEFYVSEEPISDDVQVQSQQPFAKLKVISLFPLVLQLEE